MNTQYIKDLSFENPKAPYLFGSNEKPKIDIAIDINAENFQENSYEVTINVVLKSEIKDEIQFIVELKYAALFSITKEKEEEKEFILLVECPTIIFPYVRKIISDVTRDGGYMPVNISHVDFAKLYYENKSKRQNLN